MSQPTPTISFTDLNPYKSLKHAHPSVIRISADVLRSDVQRIRGVAGDYGFLNTAVGLFIKHLHEYCELNKLNYLNTADRDTLIRHIITIVGDGANHDLDLATGPTEGRSDRERPHSNDGPRTLGMDTDDKGPKDVKRPRTRKQTSTKDK